ncbi:MAG: response regulator [Thermoanaerobaculia bacterium]
MRRSTDRFGAAILIVDDQEANVRLLEHTLRRGGYVAATSTTNSLEVCALHRRNRYDLIILDLQMPLLDGFGVLAALRAFDEQDRPAILVMSADPSQLLSSLEAGATSFLSKPFHLADVLLQVQGLLEPTALPQVAPVDSRGNGARRGPTTEAACP